ncbi:hypothetical protein, partial [Escherichia coli]|uniref:hypothetical protein n=1 Tax=Escherichia coli TaxID=562 RepID=UPI001BC8507D
AISHRQKQKKLIMLPSETMIWQPELTDKTFSRKPGAVHIARKAFTTPVSISRTKTKKSLFVLKNRVRTPLSVFCDCVLCWHA